MDISLALGIPVYNQGSTISDTIKSALNQKEQFDEIVVVDNFSTDETASVLLNFKEKIRIIRPPKHLDMVDNWNYCVGQLNGEWFSLLSGDDILKPEFVSLVKKNIIKYPDAILIRADWELINGDGVILSKHHQLSVSRITKPPKTLIEQLYGPKVSFAAFATKKSIWKKVDGFPKDFHLCHDWIFWLKISLFGPFIRIPKILAQYRTTKRPELEVLRISSRIHDEILFSRDILPKIMTQKVKKNNLSKVRSRRLIGLLDYIVKNNITVPKNDLDSLEDLAILSGIHKKYILWKFNKNYIINSDKFKVLFFVKLTLRKIYIKFIS